MEITFEQGKLTVLKPNPNLKQMHRKRIVFIFRG